jgi:hypothetical protein
MQNVFGKNLLSVFIAAQVILAGSLYSSSAEAAPRCSLRTLVQRSAEAQPISIHLSQITGVDKIKIKAGTMTKLKKVFDNHGYELSATKLKEVIEGAAEMINGTSKTPSLERSSKMAEIGREILNAVKADLTADQNKMAQFLVGEAVLRLESFKITEFKGRTELPVFKKKSTLHINKFHDLVESYVDGTAGYRDLPQDGGFLTWPEIRGLYANNSWAIGLRNHDMYHLHYAYGHPYYLAVNFHSSRSINDRRYAMISTLWEAVDTFRTGYESSIANYFKSKGMTAEEGMLHLATASEKDLDKLEESFGSYTQLTSLNELAYSSGWRPFKTKFGRNTTNYTEQIFMTEIQDFINESIERLKNPANKKYANYHRRGPGVAGSRDESAIP